jgi:hypothetical protein
MWLWGGVHMGSGVHREAAVTIEQAQLLFRLFSVVVIIPGGVEPPLPRESYVQSFILAL